MEHGLIVARFDLEGESGRRNRLVGRFALHKMTERAKLGDGDLLLFLEMILKDLFNCNGGGGAGDMADDMTDDAKVDNVG